MWIMVDRHTDFALHGNHACGYERSVALKTVSKRVLSPAGIVELFRTCDTFQRFI